MGGAKNEQDLRYRKREKAIVEALVKIVKDEDYALTVRPSRVYREARVSRSTFRRHYREVGEVFRRKDGELLREFKRSIKDDELKTAWRKTLIFIVKNREIFELKFVQADDRLLRKMVEYMEKRMDFGWAKYGTKIKGKVFEMFYAEVVGVLSIWEKEGMKIERIESAVRELAHLTKTADKRWGSVVNNL